MSSVLCHAAHTVVIAVTVTAQNFIIDFELLNAIRQYMYVETYVGVYDSRTITARRNATQILPTWRLLTQSISPTMDKQDPVAIVNPSLQFSCE